MKKEYLTKKDIWNLIFATGEERKFSKEECRKRIGNILTVLPGEFKSSTAQLKAAMDVFEKTHFPIWMESLESLAKWKRSAKDRCIERTISGEMSIAVCNTYLDKLDREQQPDLAWINKINSEIARRIDVAEDVLVDKNITSIPRVSAKENGHVERWADSAFDKELHDLSKDKTTGFSWGDAICKLSRLQKKSSKSDGGLIPRNVIQKDGK